MASVLRMKNGTDKILNDDDYEYADDINDNPEYVEHIQDDSFDDDDDDDDEKVIDQQPKVVKTKANPYHDEYNQSSTSYTDDTNLIDYVIEEENEIGGAKGENSQSISRSTTYSRY
jgi:hypothetical protein